MPLRRKNVAMEQGKLADHEMLLSVRTRFTPAEILLTPGVILLPASSRGKYRLVDATVVANGADAAGITSINIVGIQGGARVALMQGGLVGLTRGALVRLGTTNATAATDGKATLANDVNTAIYVERVGGALTGATSIDVIATYTLEVASMMSGQ